VLVARNDARLLHSMGSYEMIGEKSPMTEQVHQG
jgi:hypothetical protein